MEQISLGNILVILTIVIGLVVQYTAIIKQFTERVTKVETNLDGFEKVQIEKHRTIEKDIDILFDEIKTCKLHKDGGTDGHKV